MRRGLICFVILLYAALLLAAMTLPFDRIGWRYPKELRDYNFKDLVVHWGAFLPWMISCYALFRRKMRRGLCFTAGLIAVVALEVAQLWLPDRGFGWDDLLAGAAGMICSYVLFMLVWCSGHSGKYDA